METNDGGPEGSAFTEGLGGWAAEPMVLVPVRRLRNARVLVDRGDWVTGAKILDELESAPVFDPVAAGFARPLSPEQLIRMFKKNGQCLTYQFDLYMQGARDAEQTHGIKPPNA